MSAIRVIEELVSATSFAASPSPGSLELLGQEAEIMVERGARRGVGDLGLTLLVIMLSGARVSYDIPHGFPCAKAI